jgi:large subunit ribosomal protein L44e
MNIPKVIRKFCAKCNAHTEQKVSIYKAGKRRGSARGERRHAERKHGYGGQKFPKLAKPACHMQLNHYVAVYDTLGGHTNQVG